MVLFVTIISAVTTDSKVVAVFQREIAVSHHLGLQLHRIQVNVTLNMYSICVARADVNAYDQFNQTPLHHACFAGHEAIVELLLQHGAVVDAKTSGGVTPLMRAIQSCRVSCVEKLINFHANINATNNRGTLSDFCSSLC